MPILSFFRKYKKETVIVFDITSGSIGGALFSLSPVHKPEVLFSLREEAPFQEQFDFERFFPNILNTLHTVAERVHSAAKDLGRTPDRIVCVFSSPWYDTQTKIIHLEPAEPVTVTKTFLNDILKKHITVERAGDIGPLGEYLDDDAVLVENTIIGVKLNGYETHAPEGKQARVLDVALFASQVSRRTLGRIRGVLELFFPRVPVLPLSTGLIAYSLFRDFFPEKKHALLIRIGREITDILLVYDGVLAKTASLPFGEATLARSAAKQLDRPLIEARSLLALEDGNKVRPEVSSQLQSALTGAQKQWTGFFTEILKDFREEGAIPRDVFVMAPQGARWFVERIESDEFKHHPLTVGPFIVTVLQAVGVQEHILCAPGVSCDFFLAEAGIFLSTPSDFFLSPPVETASGS